MDESGQQGFTSFGYETVREEDKAPRVRGVFDSVARRYDLMNDLMSMGVHRLWKDAFVNQLGPSPRMQIVDCAGGTGDIALRMALRSRRGSDAAHVTIVDVNEQMLRAGQFRPEATRLASHIDWITGDAEALPLPDRFADAYTIAFGMRNVTHRDRALAEARRVLKPGGRFLCLEFSAPVVPVLDDLYERFSFNLIPKIGKWVAKDEASYRYLVESIRRFPNQEAFADEIKAAGFGNITVRNLSGGIAAIHSAWAI
ncbi:MAG TPA: bifunctional demethylmenaquinone methyltransferase/2-methoxy-6-polyprenyl-1,4-benzoquinol methylase UbiE [Alphaproteobacteria bacterium]|nr:bifunctional demethylmenaquinone methyltransferase/2-methoxy-6-polyprenyl-1,4-benzoquinol methylase UbiE [Alphaproteobacteria bacterium]